MGVHGVSGDVGLTTPNLLEAETDRALVAVSSRLVVVADHTKWGIRGLSRIADLDEADVFVSDSGLDRAARATIGQHVERLLIASSRAQRGVARSRVSSDRRDDLRTDDQTGVPAPSSSTRARTARTCRLRAARSAPAGSRRRSTTTSAGSSTAGPPCRTTAARSCSTRRSTTRRSGRSVSAGARKVVDLWAERTRRARRARRRRLRPRLREPGRRGRAPRSRIRTDRSTRSTSCPSCRSASSAAATQLDEPGDRLVAEAPGWRAWVPQAPIVPVRPAARAGRPGARPAVARRRRARRARRAARRRPRPASTACSTPRRRTCSGSTSGRSTAGDWPDARLHVEIVTPWRAPGVLRYVAAGELGSGVYFNPVAPEAAAQSLRDALEHARGSLESLLDLGGRPSWSLPELASLNRLPPTRDAAPRRAARVRDARRALGLPARRPGPRMRRGRSPTAARLGRGRGARALDDAGVRQARTTRTSGDAVRQPAADGARAERDGHLPAHVHGAAGLALAARRAPLRRLPRACSTCS